MDFGDLFRDDERFIDISEIKPEDLLEQDGVLACSKTMTALGIDRRKAFALLRKESRSKGGEATHMGRYGIKKYGTSRWFIHMPTFRNFADEFKTRFPVITKPKVQKLKKDITRQEFFQLEGIFYYRQIMELGFLPFEADHLLRHITSNSVPREDCGVWKEGHEYYLDFKTFLIFVYALKEEIPLEEARARIAKG